MRQFMDRNKIILSAIVIFALASVFSLRMFFENKRYYMQTTSKGAAYKIDRKTGKTWIIYGEEERLIEKESKPEDLSPKEKSIYLVKNSYALGGTSNVEYTIKNWMREKKGYLKIIGWGAEKSETAIWQPYEEDEAPFVGDWEATTPETESPWEADWRRVIEGVGIPKPGDNNIYLVKYKFETNEGIIGYFFEVDLSHEIVRYVIGDKVLEVRYGLRESKTE